MIAHRTLIFVQRPIRALYVRIQLVARPVPVWEDGAITSKPDVVLAEADLHVDDVPGWKRDVLNTHY